jgi:4-hydroxy-tetrahydrodipicolinate reductase
MKIALLGYGKMGKTIERIALARNHEIVLRVNQANASSSTNEELMQADVAIEFSKPHTAVSNILRCLENQVPVVVGTTGWLEQLDQVKKVCAEKNGGLFHASNFSIGVNLFFQLNERLAALMHAHTQYDVRMEEIHHIHKLDSPSGTALTLTQGIFNNLSRKTNWEETENKNAASPDTLAIHSRREGEVPGTHSIIYTSAVDQITITHEAFNREGFAHGAVLAAEFMSGKNGMFGMKDLLAL